MKSFFATSEGIFDISVGMLEMLAGSLQRNNDEPQGKSLLDEVNFKGIAQYIKSGKCKKIVTLAGAGISTCKYRGCGDKHFGDR